MKGTATFWIFCVGGAIGIGGGMYALIAGLFLFSGILFILGLVAAVVAEIEWKQTEAESKTMTELGLTQACKRCGSLLAGGATFCGQCGMKA